MLQLPGRCTSCRHQWYFHSSLLGRGVRTVHGRTNASLVRCAAAPQKAAPRHKKKVWHGGRSIFLDARPILNSATRVWHNNMCTCVPMGDYLCPWT